MLVLDTHAWIWLVAGDPALSPAARRAIEQAAAGGSVLVAAISVWEVALLEAKGRIVLGKPCRQWVADALAAPGLSLATLSPDVAVESVHMPGPFHDDTADRIIVATARAAGAALVTRDRRILDYGAQGHVAVLRA